MRLGLLVLAILLVASAMVWGVQDSWRRIGDLERKLDKIDSFRLAEDFEGRLRYLNDAIFHYAARRENSMWTDFERASTNLDRWIDQYDPRMNPRSILTTDNERKLFRKLNDGYDDYLKAARAFHGNEQVGGTMPAETYRQVGEFQGQAQKLFDLIRELAQAHRTSETAFVHEANRSLSILRSFLFGAVVLTLLLVGAFGFVLYRDQIAPLQTRLVQHQAILEKQEKLATLGTLAAGIAHEIRNPLTSVKARLYTLDKHLDSPALARVDAGVISSEISRLERIVQEVLNFARPSEPVLRSVSLSALLQEVHTLVGPSLDQRRIDLVLEPGPDLLVLADAAHLKQVLINLVHNASEAIAGTGRITLRARPAAGRDGPAAVVEVTDTGCGIPPEIEKRLFDPFFSTKPTGTGLGLSIAARIIEKHGGVLQYQTRVGHGTTFGFSLPQSRGPAKGAAPDPARRPE